MNGTTIGNISKKWSGLATELFTDADFFGINFPIDLDPRIKAVLIGALMLIVSYLKENWIAIELKLTNIFFIILQDMMHFENNSLNN